VGEEAALRSVGLQPVGVVTAGTPSWPFPFRYPPALLRRSRQGPAGPGRSVNPIDDPLTAKNMGAFSRDYASGSSVLVPDLGWSWQRVVHEEQQRQLFGATMDRLRSEAAGLGAHGIVDIRIAAVHQDVLSYGDDTTHEVRATGTAVRAPSSPPSNRVFTAASSGSHTAQLIRAGLAPSEAVFGIGIVRADLGNLTRKRLRSTGSGEVGQFSEAVQKSLDIAVADIERRAASSGQLVVGCRHEIGFERVPGASLEVRVTVIGTSVCHFQAEGDHTDDHDHTVLPVMRLDEPRR
jgi:uncharacterized protein YbjQ (UPF0145 family)